MKVLSNFFLLAIIIVAFCPLRQCDRLTDLTAALPVELRQMISLNYRKRINLERQIDNLQFMSPTWDLRWRSNPFEAFDAAHAAGRLDLMRELLSEQPLQIQLDWLHASRLTCAYVSENPHIECGDSFGLYQNTYSKWGYKPIFFAQNVDSLKAMRENGASCNSSQSTWALNIEVNAVRPIEAALGRGESIALITALAECTNPTMLRESLPTAAATGKYDLFNAVYMHFGLRVISERKKQLLRAAFIAAVGAPHDGAEIAEEIGNSYSGLITQRTYNDAIVNAAANNRAVTMAALLDRSFIQHLPLQPSRSDILGDTLERALLVSVQRHSTDTFEFLISRIHPHYRQSSAALGRALKEAARYGRLRFIKLLLLQFSPASSESLLKEAYIQAVAFDRQNAAELLASKAVNGIDIVTDSVASLVLNAASGNIVRELAFAPTYPLEPTLNCVEGTPVRVGDLAIAHSASHIELKPAFERLRAVMLNEK